MADATSGFGYERVEAGIIRMIHSEGFEVGARLPTLDQLRHRHGVSSTTIRTAVDNLKQRGILESRQGSGLYVLKLPDSDDVGAAVDDVEEIRSAVAGLRQEIHTLGARLARLEELLQLQEQSAERPVRQLPRRARKPAS